MRIKSNAVWRQGPLRTTSSAGGGVEEDAQQVRAAFLAAGHLEGYTSITEFIEAATMREVRRLQRKYNAGKKWPGVPAGALRRGRRTREEIGQQNAERP